MRLLVACPECRRQYEAGKLRPGGRFRCGCGKVLRVKAPKGRDAAVVRCSGCGAPREEGAAACAHCGGDFTLHERDLDTVCPHCLTRVSDKARYCHCCGKALVAKSVAGERSRLQCPSCPGRPHLHSRRLGKEDFAVLECQLCAGLWIESRVFQELTQKAEEKQEIDAALLTPRRDGAEPPKSRVKWSYRKCPVCGKMMQRRNYARRSGVIIDVCRSDGIWFDADELQRILAWIRDGGMQLARQRSQEEQRETETRRNIAAAGDSTGGYDDDWFGWGTRRGYGESMIDAVIGSIFFG